jgi:hypothetical protein
VDVERAASCPPDLFQTVATTPLMVATPVAIITAVDTHAGHMGISFLLVDG